MAEKQHRIHTDSHLDCMNLSLFISDNPKNIEELNEAIRMAEKEYQ
jgi:hypothetical protein